MTRACQYVVLHHTGYGEPHYDFMVAIDDTGPLLTWRCPSWPVDDPTVAQPLPDHRRAYLTYEGEVSNGRGFVTRVASGLLQFEHLNSTHVIIRLDERRMTFSRSQNHS